MLSKHEFTSRGPAAVYSPVARPARTTFSPIRGRLRSAVFTGAALAAIWQVLHWGDPASWIVGGPAVIGGALAAAAFPSDPRPGLSLPGLVRFTAFVTAGVLRGAVDVGIRSLRPGRLEPGFIDYRTGLPEGAPRRIFALFITMMPGTLTVRLDGAQLTVHALDLALDVPGDLRALEQRVAALFGLDMFGDAS